MIRSILILSLLSGLLIACTPLPGTGPAPRIFDLGQVQITPDGEERVRKSLVVEEPQATRVLDTDRIALRPNDVEVQYLADSRWSDRAPRLIQTLLVQGFESSGRIRSVGRQAIGLRSDFALKGELWAFEADFSEAGSPRVTVRLSAKLVNQTTASIKAIKQFEKTVDASSTSAIDLVAAFNSASSAVVQEAVSWTLATMSGKAAE